MVEDNTTQYINIQKAEEERVACEFKTNFILFI